jgi:bifunctional UDP-N-acetylglucosamine pyrophosphorylase / glucosamine-1-phosphate N-acetyltransferase
MKSELAKVLHPICGRDMVGHVVASAKAAGLQPVVVVHHQEEAVREALAGADVRFARQEQTRGTGDAVAAALSVLPESGTVLVMAGDAPLIRPKTMARLLAAHADRAVTVLTALMEEPAHYGRLCRDDAGRPSIIEARECTPDQLAITEINTGLYAFDIKWLRQVLPSLPVHSDKGEVYLTDTVAVAAKQDRAGVVVHSDIEEVLGVNDRWDLAVARRVLQGRIIQAHARQGVSFIEPGSTVVDVQVHLEPDCEIGAGAVITGCSSVGTGTVIGPHCVLHNTTIGSGVQVLAHTVTDDAVVHDGVRHIGPMARLRAGTVLKKGARVGNFVEVKNATFEPGATAGHLSYIGDATVGADTNVGAGTITCNYDGFSKHHTDIGEGAFIGSNTALVAPVQIGAGAIIGAGSVIVRSVPDGAVSVARGDQIDRLGAAERIRQRKRKP